MTPAVGCDEATEYRNGMTDRLITDGLISSPVVAAAFRTVPRHEFVPPGTPLELAYCASESVPVKTDEHGVVISSVSAPFVHAQMIGQAGIGPGMRVLEIGSGGCQAAILAEVTGPDGYVVSVDIDPEVIGNAAGMLKATGYADRVTLLLGDAEDGVAEHAPYDAVLVTAGAWDIAPAWTAQLKPGGRLVAPLRMNSITRSIAWSQVQDHLVSTSAEVCGFVPMQGVGGHAERAFVLPGPDGQVTLRFEDRPPKKPSLLDGVLGAERTEAWSGVTVRHGVSFADLHLWLAGFLPGFCRVSADDGALAGERPGKDWFPFGTIGEDGGSFAYLAVRPALDGAGVEFGARAYGRHGLEAAGALVSPVQAWDRHGREVSPDAFAFWPAGAGAPLPDRTAVFPKAHGTVTISWPSGAADSNPPEQGE
jgi:protein-L-isoaspartate(D-aspartate) O-methyltransferase